MSKHHHENCDIECHEGGDCAGRVSGFIRGDDDSVTGHGPSDRQDVQPGACATLFVFGYNVRDKARVGTCDPVPPKLQEYERRRVKPEARSGAERKQQQEADAAAEDSRDQEKPASSVPMLRAVRKRAGEWRDDECHDSSGREDDAADRLLGSAVTAKDDRDLIRHDDRHDSHPLRGQGKPEE